MTVAELNNHFSRFFQTITLRDKRKKEDFELYASNNKFVTQEELDNFLNPFWDREVADWEYCYDDNHLYLVVD